MPADADTAVGTQVLLGTVTCADDCGTVSTIDDVPTLTFGAITADSAADKGGVAAWGRAKSGEATPVAVLDAPRKGWPASLAVLTRPSEVLHVLG